MSEPLIERTLSDLIVDYLTLLGVEYVFGVPGGHIGGLYEALARSAARGGPRAVVTRQEAAAAFMASGYARESGKLGVCCGTTNPGTTNLITGVAAANADQDPILVLTGQSLLAHFGRGSFQESSPDVLDTTAMLGYCTRYNSLVTHPQQLEHKLLAALLAALRPPYGAAHLSIPVDIYRTVWPAAPAYAHQLAQLQSPYALMDHNAFEQLWQRVEAAHRAHQPITLFIGANCRGAAASIEQLAERLGAQVVTTQSGKNWVNAYHPRVKGVFGFAGHTTARQALAEAELIIAAGARFGQWGSSSWDSILINQKLVHIHPDARYFRRSLAASLHLEGEVEPIFKALLARLDAAGIAPVAATPPPSVAQGETPPQIAVNPPPPDSEWVSPMKPQWLMQRLRRDLPETASLVVDAGNVLTWSIHHFFSRQPDSYQLSVETATMAWGIGAAVGVALAHPHRAVACIAGDGSWLMSSQEMSVAVAEGLPILYIILNDGAYNMIEQNQRQKSPISLPFPIPATDFARLAEGLGGYGEVIHNAAEWDRLDLAAIFQRDRPTLLDIRLDATELAPLGLF